MGHSRSLGRGIGKNLRKASANAMLDLYAVKTQIDDMVVDERRVQEDFRAKLELALAEYRRWEPGWQKLATKINKSRTSWLLPGMADGLGGGVERPERPAEISIAATDGSQIFPDRHEVSSCFLINIGYILLHYGTGEKPLMSSKPKLYYREEEIFEEWGGRRMFVNRDLVGFKRSLMEFTELADLALAANAEGHPVVALSDGTLILWNLEGKPQDFKESYLQTTLEAMDNLRDARIPVAGYISNPGSQELINALKLGLCPLEVADCDRCPWQAENQLGFNEDEIGAMQSDLWRGHGLPCSPLEGLNDAVLVSHVLSPGQRTPLYLSTSKILNEYGSHRVYYFYLHVGAEIGRVEIPEWVATDPELLELVHACMCDQADKGQGYPVALAEAHERAVVRGADRDTFYRFLRDTFVNNDIQTSISTKSFTKRYVGI